MQFDSTDRTVTKVVLKLLLFCSNHLGREHRTVTKVVLKLSMEYLGGYPFS